MSSLERAAEGHNLDFFKKVQNKLFCPVLAFLTNSDTLIKNIKKHRQEKDTQREPTQASRISTLILFQFLLIWLSHISLNGRVAN